VEKKKVFIWVALIAIIAVIIFNIFRNGKENEDMTISQNFSNVAIESENADIHLFPVEGGKAFIELENNHKNRYRLDVKVKGKTLEIEVERRGFKWFSFDFFSKSPQISVGLPTKEYNTIEVETDNGTINASQLNVKQLVAQTDNGEINVEEMKSEAIVVESDNGEILIADSLGKINGQTNNGDVTVQIENLNQPMDLETDNGEIVVQTKEKAKNVQFKVETDNGDVNIYGQSTTDKVIGNGNILIKLASDNGDITVE